MRYTYALETKGLKVVSVYVLSKEYTPNNGVRLTTRVYCMCGFWTPEYQSIDMLVMCTVDYTSYLIIYFYLLSLSISLASLVWRSSFVNDCILTINFGQAANLMTTHFMTNLL